MDPLFDPAWGQYLTLASDSAGYVLLVVFAVSFVWACAAIGSSAVPPPKEGKSGGDTTQDKKDLP